MSIYLFFFSYNHLSLSTYDFSIFIFLLYTHLWIFTNILTEYGRNNCASGNYGSSEKQIARRILLQKTSCGKYLTCRLPYIVKFKGKRRNLVQIIVYTRFKRAKYLNFVIKFKSDFKISYFSLLN